MEGTMKNITKLPRFMPGQVIDLSYKSKGLPNRILIKTVFIREHNSTWIYEVFLENTGEVTSLDQDFIVANMTKKDREVYKCREIINLYNDGWRFCGNFGRTEAHKVAAQIATTEYVKNVILKPALDYRGVLINDKYGIWIRYNNIIYDNGTINDNSNKDTIVIK
jgi:hypothetical protein